MDGSLRQGHAEYIVPPEDSGWTPGSTAAGEEQQYPGFAPPTLADGAQ